MRYRDLWMTYKIRPHLVKLQNRTHSGGRSREHSPVRAVHRRNPPTEVLIETSAVHFFETVSHKQMSVDQLADIDVQKHRAGEHVKDLVIESIEFTPGVFLLCDTAHGTKPRPIVPKNHRKTIISM